MATLTMTKRHHLSHGQAKKAAQKVADDLRERFELDYRWRGDIITFQRPGLKGELSVGPDEVRLDAQLGFLLSALKPAIEQAVEREFGKHFGNA